MSSSSPLTFYVIPWSSLGWGGFGAVVALASLVVPGAGLGTRLVVFGVGVVLGAIGGLVVVRRLGRLSIGDRIAYRRLFVRLEVPLEAARVVRVQRRLSLNLPSFYDLVVEVKGREVRLPIAAYYWFGPHLMARARSVAERLSVPMEDPKGDAWRASRFLPLRVLGAGHDWLFVLGVAVVVVPVVLGLGGLAVLLR